MDPNLNHKKFAILTIYKNIVKKFMTIVLLLKKSLILLKRVKVQEYFLF